MPPDSRAVAILAEAGVTRGRLAQVWLQEFLHAASYPAPEKLLDRLFPVSQIRPRPPRVYENLPAPLYSQFIMREAFVEIIDGLRQRSAAVLIVGLGGNGKTSLAREIAAHCLKERADVPQFDAAVWVTDKDRPGTTTLSTVLDEIARTLGYPGFAELAHDEKLREVGQLLRHQRVLLVIDNFETIADRALGDWLLRLPEPSKALITSREHRRELRGSWPIELRGMSEDEAQDLIAQRLRMLRLDKLVSNHAQFEPLIAVTGGNPKAIEMSLGIVKYARRSLDQVIDDLYAARGDLFNDLFARAWALLDSAEQRIVLAMTLFTGSASSEALAATAEVHGFTFDRAIERLTDLSLLDVEQVDLSRTPRYMLHPLIRAFAARKLVEQQESETQARTRWCAYFVDFLNRYAVRDKPAERYWNSLTGSSRLVIIDTELSNLLSVLEWVDQREQPALLIELMMQLVHIMDRRGLYAQRVYYARKAAGAADLLGQGRDPAFLRDAALCYTDALGYTLIQQGRFEEAIQAITIGLERAQALDPESADARDLLALGHAFLAWAHLESGNVERAVEYINPIQLEGCRTVIRHRVTMIRGAIAHARGEYTAAIAFFNEAARLAEEYGGEDAAIDDLNQMLGFTYLASGDLEQAKARFSSVIALKDRAGTIEAIRGTYGLACVAFEEGDRHTAYQLARAAQDALMRLKILHRMHQNIRDFLARFEVGDELALG